jgi:hypothetical protein
MPRVLLSLLTHIELENFTMLLYGEIRMDSYRVNAMKQGDETLQ